MGSQMSQKITTGYFVDWNGDVRSIERLGGGYTCGPLVAKGQGEDAFQSIEIYGSDGLVIFEATYYPTLDAVEAIGISVNLTE